LWENKPIFPLSAPNAQFRWRAIGIQHSTSHRHVSRACMRDWSVRPRPRPVFPDPCSKRGVAARFDCWTTTSGWQRPSTRVWGVRGNCLLITEADHQQLGRSAPREYGVDVLIITDASSRKFSTGEWRHSGSKELKIDVISQRPRQKHNPISSMVLQFGKNMVLGETYRRSRTGGWLRTWLWFHSGHRLT